MFLRLALTGLMLMFVPGSISGHSFSSCPNDLPYTTAILKHHSTCYQFVYVERYWTEARDYCRLYNGRLVKVDNSETNQFIIETLNAIQWKNNGVWIGLHDRLSEMDWKWDGGRYQDEAASWTNWGRGHPAASLHTFRDCVRMVRGGGTWRWHETPCHLLKWHYRFICQYQLNATEHLHPTPASNNRLRGGWLGSESRHWSTGEQPLSTTDNTDIEHEIHLDDGTMSRQAGSKESDQKSSTATVVVIVLSILAVAILLLIFFVLRRRRYAVLKQLEEADDIIYSDIDKDQDEKKPASLKTSAYLKREKEIWVTLLHNGGSGLRSVFRKPAQNIYVEAPVKSSQSKGAAPADTINSRATPGASDSNAPSKSLYLSMNGTTSDKIKEAETPDVYSTMNGDECVNGDGKPVYENRKSGVAGAGKDLRAEEGKKEVDEYDEPRKLNVYSEIPEQMNRDDNEYELETDHIYECLPDAKNEEKCLEEKKI